MVSLSNVAGWVQWGDADKVLRQCQAHSKCPINAGLLLPEEWRHYRPGNFSCGKGQPCGAGRGSALPRSGGGGGPGRTQALAGGYPQGPGLPASEGWVTSGVSSNLEIASLCYGSSDGSSKAESRSFCWLPDTPAVVFGNVFIHPGGKWTSEKWGLGFANAGLWATVSPA